MRITKRHSTKSERIVYEILKELHIKFKHRWLIKGREVDFIVGNIAIEIDGHEQDEEKNNMLIENGYVPVHFHNSEILNNRPLITQILLCLLQDSNFLPSRTE